MSVLALTDPALARLVRSAAEQYQELGLNVIPFLVTRNNGRTDKKPLIEWKIWQDKKQTVEDLASFPWKEANAFAVVSGMQGSNGLFFTVVDVDNPDFDMKFTRTTQTERTPRGGYHFVYWTRKNAKGHKRQDLKIELLGQGNLCIMYPSEGYSKLNDNLPTEIDSAEQLFEELVEKLGGKKERKVIDVDRLLKGVNVGERDNAAIEIATFYRKERLNQEETLEKLKRWNEKNEQPLGEEQLREKVESAFKNPEPYNYHFKDEERRRKKQYKDSGLSQDGYFEAIYAHGNPAFLLKKGDGFSIVESVEVNGEDVYPKDARHVSISYEPYGYYEQPMPTLQDLFLKVRKEFQAFIDVEPTWLDVLTACVLLSYQQEKLQTVPYVFVYGDNESGKSTVLELLKFLCYRPLYGVTITSANLYGYLEDSDSIGTILEDEIQGIHKDTDKIKIYKAGYKKGAVVPRTILTQNDRIQKYYNTFCFKACASEQIPLVKGFNERFIFIPMVEGSPKKEWADITQEDLDRLHNLRNILLKWRLERRECELPEVQLPIKGRVKELWKPILQMTYGLPVYDDLLKFVEEQKNERLSARQNTLEGHIVKVVLKLFTEKDETIPFLDIWWESVHDLDGKIDDRKPHVMETSEFGKVTKNKVGYRLREVLSGESKPIREKDAEGNDTVIRVYIFDPEKLKRIARKYGYELVTKLPTLPNSESAQTLRDMEKVQENNVERGLLALSEPDKVSNLVTDGEGEN